MRFVTGGCENSIKIWTLSSVDTSKIDDENITDKVKIEILESHNDWVRDVAWLNYVGYAHDTIASCSEVNFIKTSIKF